MSNGTLRLYGCGGGGINIVSAFSNTDAEIGYANISTSFIDTSTSNINDGIDKEDCFILPDVDGSGKIRKENHEAISESVKSILVRHKPEEFNVVVFTGAGGTGGVVGVLLVRELLERGHSVVCIVIGSSESAITCTNTINTIKSLDNISKKKETPIAMVYEHNDGKRSVADIQIKRVISSIAALCAGDTRELDSRDISTWLNYQRACEVPAQLVELVVCDTNDEIENLDDIVSLASLLRDEDTDLPSVYHEYSTHGYSNVKSEVKDKHFALLTNGVSEIFSKLTKIHDEYVEAKNSRNHKRNTFVDSGDVTTDDDMVL